MVWSPTCQRADSLVKTKGREKGGAGVIPTHKEQSSVLWLNGETI